jgi:hypothetical protein
MLPEITANAADNAFTAPRSSITRSAASLKCSNVASGTESNDRAASSDADLMMSAVVGAPIFLNVIPWERYKKEV